MSAKRQKAATCRSVAHLIQNHLRTGFPMHSQQCMGKPAKGLSELRLVEQPALRGDIEGVTQGVETIPL